MTRTELLARRWGAQVLETPLGAPADVAARLCAVQAQDFGQSLLAVGIRTDGATAETVEAVLNSGDIIRAHVLRPTWHLVHRDDLRWMTELTAPEIAKIAGTQYRKWGLTPEVLTRSRRVLEAALKDGPATRDELNAALGSAGFSLEETRATHHLIDAELNLVICAGPRRGKAITYDLVDRRVPPSAPVPRDEALAQLALRYVQGHGPATDRDFSWWSGLGLTDARRGLRACEPRLTTAPSDNAEVWYDPDGPEGDVRGYRWLPAFDEYIIAFADRSPVIDPPHFDKAYTKNGIFKPTVLLDGRAVGTWAKDGKGIRVEWFGQAPQDAEPEIQRWTAQLGSFWGEDFGESILMRKRTRAPGGTAVDSIKLFLDSLSS